MRTTVNTTKRTTYVVTDHDIIEALAALGIPRSVLLSEDTTIKMDEETRYEEGFDFCGADNTPFLTVEAPAEESEESEESEASVDSTPEPVKEDVYPNGTVLIGQYSGVAYTIRGYDPATSTYTVARPDWSEFQERYFLVHSEDYKPAATLTPAPKPNHFPVGTILRYCGNEYFVVGHVAPPEEYAEGYRLWCINDKRTAWERYDRVHNPATWTVVHRPTPGLPTPGEGAPTDPFPVGTVLRYNLGSGVLACVTGYASGVGYAITSVLYKTGWDTYDSAHRDYTVLYRPPSKA